MKLAGIIAEYNPFHNGHACHIAKTREAGATHIAVVMSGDFVQRGDIAAFSKFSRAKAAVSCGADLVIELPVIYSLAGAQTFARAGIYLLNELGIDMLSFGSECGSLLKLQKAVHCFEKAEHSDKMTGFLKNGMSYPRSLAAAVSALYGEEYTSLITGPNNLLAIEYLKALNSINPSVQPIAVPRINAQHDSMVSSGFASSASYIRYLLTTSNLDSVFPYVPIPASKIYAGEVNAHRAPVTADAIDKVILHILRGLTKEEFAVLPDVSEGLENRLYRISRNVKSLSEFFKEAKTKRYTMARIRRIVFCAILSITKEAQTSLPAYIRILAINEKGAEILARAKKQTVLPIGANFADLYRLSPHGIEYDINSTDFFSLAMPEVYPCGMDFTEKIVIQKNC